MNKIVIASALVLAALTTGASAQRYHDGQRQDAQRYDSQREIDARQQMQEQRIQNARRAGELTRQEYQSLEAEQARIREMERRAQRDGRIDGREAAEIRRAQNEASRHIYQESHDSEQRGRGHGFWNRRWW